MNERDDIDAPGAYYKQGKGLGVLWAGLLAGPFAWAMQLGLSYPIVPLVCMSGRHLTLHLVTLGALALAVVGIALSWRNWRTTGREWPDEAGGALPRSRFMAVIGIALSVLFSAAIVAQGLLNFLLDPCA